MGRNVKDGVVNDYQLALVSRAVFDIGPRTRVVTDVRYDRDCHGIHGIHGKLGEPQAGSTG